MDAPTGENEQESLELERPRKFRRTPSGLLDCRRVLTRTFMKDDYKGKQKEIVEAAVLGADVFVVAPTGMGKSLCFQIPALADTHGMTIVVSPLLALMKNQVAKLQELDVPAVALTSETPITVRKQIQKDLASGHPFNRLLYITPEKLMSPEFQNMLKLLHEQKELSRLVVDEAHCISSWGHDFRAEYRKLGHFRERFPDVPIMALTASATPIVQEDIVKSLRMSVDHLCRFLHPFNRANLFYEIRYFKLQPTPDEQYELIYGTLAKWADRRGRASCGIIYARARKTCDELAAFLQGRGVAARPYHRGIASAQLDKTFDAWTESEGCEVVVATVCFGMGIDKANVRWVIHYDLPLSFEGYYQETGRAGRDGKPARCVLYYSREDVVRVKKWVSKSHNTRQQRSELEGGPSPSQRAPNSLQRLVELCEDQKTCRHVAICQYFGEEVDSGDTDTRKEYCNNMCDICKNPDKVRRDIAALSSEQFVLTQAPQLEREAERDVEGSIEDQDVALSISPARSRNIAANTANSSKGSRPAGALQTAMSPINPGPENESETSPWTAQTASSKNEIPESSTGRSTFRVPFKLHTVPSKRIDKRTSSGEAGSPDVIELSDDDETPEVHSNPVRSTDQSRRLPEVRAGSPVVDDSLGEVEAPFNDKIPASLRNKTMNGMYQQLYKSLMVGLRAEDNWMRLGGEALDSVERASTLRICAKRLEFMVMNHSASTKGYELRSAMRINGLQALASGECVLVPPKRSKQSLAQSLLPFRKEMEELCGILNALTEKWKRTNARSADERRDRPSDEVSLPETLNGTMDDQVDGNVTMEWEP